PTRPDGHPLDIRLGIPHVAPLPTTQHGEDRQPILLGQRAVHAETLGVNYAALRSGATAWQRQKWPSIGAIRSWKTKFTPNVAQPSAEHVAVPVAPVDAGASVIEVLPGTTGQPGPLHRPRFGREASWVATAQSGQVATRHAHPGVPEQLEP